MKTFFKLQIILSAIILLIALNECRQKDVNPNAVVSLNRLKSLVDTISMCKEKESYLLAPDYSTIEIPIDPKNPAITRIDTTYITVEEKRKMGFAKTGIAETYKEMYEIRLKETEAYQKDMNDAMRKELNDIKDKFDKIYKQ